LAFQQQLSFLPQVWTRVAPEIVLLVEFVWLVIQVLYVFDVVQLMLLGIVLVIAVGIIVVRRHILH